MFTAFKITEPGRAGNSCMECLAKLVDGLYEAEFAAKKVLTGWDYSVKCEFFYVA
jgi:hypothetical protein